MFSLILFSLWKLFLSMQTVATNGQNIIDLSIINYSIYESYGEIRFIFLAHHDIINVKIKSCQRCPRSDRLTITCGREVLVQTEIRIMKENKSMSVPFNFTCVTYSVQKFNLIINFKSSADESKILVAWQTKSSSNIHHFIIYCINNNGNYIRDIVRSEASSHQFTKLTEKTWYRICIASVDNTWGTSMFKCLLSLTSFSHTGPVTNLSIDIYSYKIQLSWAKPQYEMDSPQGYIVNVKGSLKVCQTLIISMTSEKLQVDNVCPNQKDNSWTRLQSLKIDNLSPHSDYQVEIFPINRNKSSIKEYLSIKTKEGESEAVRNLQVEIQSGDRIVITFEKPCNPNGIIIKYLVRLINSRIMICRKIDNIIFETFFNKEHGYISTKQLPRCGSFVIEVSPINRWDHNEGMGKTASTVFNYNLGPRPTVSVDSDITSNLIFVHLSDMNVKETCGPYAYVVAMVNMNDPSDCVTRIISYSDCTQWRNMVSDRLKCSNIGWVKWKRRYSDSVISLRAAFYSTGLYHIRVWRMKKIMEEIYSQFFIDVCYTDCHSMRGIYNGIRSADMDGQVCTAWITSQYSYQEYTKSNICNLIGDSRPWCPVGESWQYCDIPKCSDNIFDKMCTSIENINKSTNFVSIKWSFPQHNKTIGYITLLHNSDQFCEQYHIQLCDGCGSPIDFHSQVNNFYLSCNNGQLHKTIKQEAQFNNLHQNKQYFVYIIPVFGLNSVGNVKGVSVRTHLSRLFSGPMTPQNVVVKSRTHQSIEFSWENSKNYIKYGQADRYFVVLRLSKSGDTQEIHTNQESVRVTNLNPCTQYCFSLTANNEAGSSKFSDEICSSTLATKPRAVEIEDPTFEDSTTQVIQWYSGNDNNCERRFIVEYFIRDGGKSQHLITNKTSIKLENLKPNEIYVVKVRQENPMEKMNDENIGTYTQIEFYSGLSVENESVKNVRLKKMSSLKIQISYEVARRFLRSIKKYNIKIFRTHLNICLNINELVYQSFFYKTKGNILVNKLHKCGSYVVQVIPVGKWTYGRGFWKIASKNFKFNIDDHINPLVNIQFISWNSVIVYISNLKGRGTCNTLAIVMEITNEKNPSNCFTKVIAYVDCSDLRKMVTEEIKCPHVELDRWNKDSASINTRLFGIFNHQSRYSVRVMKITNRIEDVESLSITNENFEDCFTDCYSNRRFYSGIRSLDRNGNKCLSWKNTRYSNLSYTRSNLCSTIADNKPWCPIADSWKYCDIPLCSDIRHVTGCVSVYNIKILDSSVYVRWSPPQYNQTTIGYITLLHNTSYYCEQYHIQMCSQCGSHKVLKIQVKNFYLSCLTGSFDGTITFKVVFKEIDSNKNYLVYIIPIIDQSSVGEVKKMGVKKTSV